MERNAYGHASVTFTEIDGLLVAHAIGSAAQWWAASRTSGDSLASAVVMAIMDDGMSLNEYPRVGISHHSEAAAIRAYQEIEKQERWDRNEKEGLCHCGHNLFDSDHCPLCGCEQYEAYCDTTYHDSPIGRAACDCPYHS